MISQALFLPRNICIQLDSFQHFHIESDIHYTNSRHHYFAHFSTEAANRVVYTFTTNYPDGTADGTMREGVYGLFDSVQLNYPETIPSTGSY